MASTFTLSGSCCSMRRGATPKPGLSPPTNCRGGEWITIVGRITRADLIRMKRRNGQFLKVLVDDDTRVYEASFFNPRYIKNKLQPGARVAMAGKVGLYQGGCSSPTPNGRCCPTGPTPTSPLSATR